ncbi:MAG: glycerate kinase [Clostridia bacterium]|nr:glycerate kinase [Clostridia bacterium]
MRSFLVISDSYKGCLTSSRAADIIKSSILKIIPSASVMTFSVADGGEGTVDSFLSSLNGEEIIVECKDALFRDMKAKYAAFDDFAVIETASCAGLTLVGDRKDVRNTTTFGIGEQIRDALNRGFKRILLGLGGSATNDAGCGMASALGYRFFDSFGKQFIPTGGTLRDIAVIDRSQADKRIYDTEFIAMCDISNPLYGPEGAAFVFGPQKGADRDDILILDEGLRNFEARSGMELDSVKGAGAAGGLGAGIVAFLDGKLKNGIDTILEMTGIVSEFPSYDLIITGEGSFDDQSLSGKVPIGIARKALKYHVPVIVICGSRKGRIESAYSEGVTAVFDITEAPQPLSDAIDKAEENLAYTTENIIRLISLKDSR